MDQFSSLLHDRQVGGEDGVKDLVKAEPPQAGYHLAGGDRPGCRTEGLGNRDPNGRSGLDNHMLGRIEEDLPDLVRIVLLGQRPSRTDQSTLPAEGTGRIVNRSFKERGHLGVEAPLGQGDGRHALDLPADRHAALAEDALGAIDRERRRVLIAARRMLFALDLHTADTQLPREAEQFTVLRPNTGGAGDVVVGEDQFEHHLPGFPDGLAVGLDHHAFGHRQGACGLEPAGAGCLDQAHPAGTDLVDLLQITERRNADTIHPRRFQHRRTGLHGDGAPVYGQVDHAAAPLVSNSVELAHINTVAALNAE